MICEKPVCECALKGIHPRACMEEQARLGAADQQACAEWLDGEGRDVVIPDGIWHAAIAYERGRAARSNPIEKKIDMLLEHLGVGKPPVSVGFHSGFAKEFDQHISEDSKVGDYFNTNARDQAGSMYATARRRGFRISVTKNTNGTRRVQIMSRLPKRVALQK